MRMNWTTWRMNADREEKQREEKKAGWSEFSNVQSMVGRNHQRILREWPLKRRMKKKRRRRIKGLRCVKIPEKKKGILRSYELTG